MPFMYSLARLRVALALASFSLVAACLDFDKFQVVEEPSTPECPTDVPETGCVLAPIDFDIDPVPVQANPLSVAACGSTDRCIRIGAKSGSKTDAKFDGDPTPLGGSCTGQMTLFSAAEGAFSYFAFVSGTDRIEVAYRPGSVRFIVGTEVTTQDIDEADVVDTLRVRRDGDSLVLDALVGDVSVACLTQDAPELVAQSFEIHFGVDARKDEGVDGQSTLFDAYGLPASP